MCACYATQTRRGREDRIYAVLINGRVGHVRALFFSSFFPPVFSFLCYIRFPFLPRTHRFSSFFKGVRSQKYCIAQTVYKMKELNTWLSGSNKQTTSGYYRSCMNAFSGMAPCEGGDKERRCGWALSKWQYLRSLREEPCLPTRDPVKDRESG